MEKNEIITPKFDALFKAIFGSEGSENILKSFIQEVLDIKIDKLYLTNTEMNNKPVDGKQNRLDILAVLSDGKKVNIEMQNASKSDFEKRALQYWAELYTSAFKKGENYNVLHKTYAIWILDYNKIKESDDFHNIFKIKEQNNHKIQYFDDLELHLLELPKHRKYVKMKKENELTLLDKWLIFIDFSDKEMVEMAVRSVEELQEAMQKYEELSSDTEMVRVYQQLRRIKADELSALEHATKEGHEAGMKQGMEKGMKQGKKEAIKEVAKKLKKQNVAIEVIMSSTGLCKEEIENL